MNKDLSHNKKTMLDLIACRGLEGYGLYMYLLNLSDENVFTDEFIDHVVDMSHQDMALTISTCVEFGLIDLKIVGRG
jgi:hypothetical protein